MHFYQENNLYYSYIDGDQYGIYLYILTKTSILNIHSLYKKILSWQATFIVTIPTIIK